MLLVGLGNPGQNYARNRHNVGFMAVQSILHRHNFSPLREKFHSQYTSGTLNGQTVHVLMPQTFMNLSGKAVQAAASFYKIAPADIVVFHDELDFDLGTVKLKMGGGPGGHNGLKSITAQLGTPDYLRVRMGIGHPGRKELVTGYVLGNFTADEQVVVDKLCTTLADWTPNLTEDYDTAQNSLSQAFK